MLEVEGVVAGYGSLVALDGVSLSVARGEFVGLLGANNAGKSTLANVVCGLVPLRAGSVRLDGAEISGLSAHQRVERGLVQVPEGRSLFPQMTVHENLWLGGYCRRARARRAAFLERVHRLFPVLRERAAQPVGQLSGGQQQMVAVGRALMADPRVLVLDEPSLGLAPLICRQVFDVLAGLGREGMTILLVEQNMNLSLAYTNRAYVLERGRIVHHGASAELRKSEDARRAYFGLGEAGPGANGGGGGDARRTRQTEGGAHGVAV